MIERELEVIFDPDFFVKIGNIDKLIKTIETELGIKLDVVEEGEEIKDIQATLEDENLEKNRLSNLINKF